MNEQFIRLLKDECVLLQGRMEMLEKEMNALRNKWEPISKKRRKIYDKIEAYERFLSSLEEYQTDEL